MKTLHLPIRGRFTQLAATSEHLVLRSHLSEGDALGLNHLRFAELARGVVHGESAHSLIAPNVSFSWIGGVPSSGAASDEALIWAIDRHQRVYHLDFSTPTSSEDQAEQAEDSPEQAGGGYALTWVGTLDAPPRSVCALDARRLAVITEAEADVEAVESLSVWALSDVHEALPPGASEQPTGFASIWSAPLDTAHSSLSWGKRSLAVGLTSGEICLWFEATGVSQGEEANAPLWRGPLSLTAHEGAVTAIGFVHADNKDYLLSYGQDLKLSQARLDDLEPMPRSSKGKGLHTQPVGHLITGPLGRFYTLGQDGAVKSWQDAFSNQRPANVDGLGALIDGAIINDPRQSKRGAWSVNPVLALLTDDALTFYGLESEPQVDHEVDRGKLTEALRGIDGAEAWAKHRLSDREESTRASALSVISAWGDALSLSLLSTVARSDQSPALRGIALNALIVSGHPQAIHIFETLLSSEFPEISVGALKAMCTSYGAESLFPLRQALSKGAEAAGIATIDLLKSRVALRDEPALALLKETINHSNEVIAKAATLALHEALPAPQGGMLGLKSTHRSAQRLALQALYRAGSGRLAAVQGALQALREDDHEEIRAHALGVTLLSSPRVAQLLRSGDEKLHDLLCKIEAYDLDAAARNDALSAKVPKEIDPETLEESDLQLLFELTSCGREDVAIYGPVALAKLGDLRALPILLSLSRSTDDVIRWRATSGLYALSMSGERRAFTQLQRLCSDEASQIRLLAYRGVGHLLKNEPLTHAEIGLSSTHHDVRLASLSALIQLKLTPDDADADEGDQSRAHQALTMALNHRGDLPLAQEARKVFLKANIGGDALRTQLLLLESVHPQIRRATLDDLVSASQEPVRPTGSGASSLEGMSFVFTGTLTTMKRKDAQTQVTSLGGNCPSGVSASLNYLVIGDGGKAGSKLDKAKKFGVRVLSESEFTQLIAEASGGGAEGVEGAEEVETPNREVWALTLFKTLISDPTSGLRLDALNEIIGMKEGSAVLSGRARLDGLELALYAPHLDVRLKALQAIESTDDHARTMTLLKGLLGDAEERVALYAFEIALKLNDDKQPWIEDGLAHETEALRSLALQAAVSASKSTDWRGSMLWSALTDGAPSIRAKAMTALRGDEAVEIASKLLDSPFPDVRDRAAMTLARAGDVRALDVVLEVLTTPAPTLDEITRAQEQLGGDLGLVDDFQWRRNVVMALSAQQSAVVSAQAFMSASADSETSSDSSVRVASGAEAHAVATVNQSILAMMSVNDEIEGALERAHRKWCARVCHALSVAEEGAYEGAFDAIWALRDCQDAEVAERARATWWATCPSDEATLLLPRLKAPNEVADAAWALVMSQHSAGLHALLTDGAQASDHVSASLCLWSLQRSRDRAERDLNERADRALSELISKGQEGADLALTAELLTLWIQGGEASLTLAGLSSADRGLRRRAARLIAASHSTEAIEALWLEEMEARRPDHEVKLEREHLAFKAGTRKEKPKQAAPRWPTVKEWRDLATLISNSDLKARRTGLKLLAQLPTDSATTIDWLKALKRRIARLTSADAQARETRSMLGESEARALAYGAYASLVSVDQDIESLKRLVELTAVDPIGTLALIKVSLRGTASLRRVARELMRVHRDALNLSPIDHAEQLIATGVDDCIREGVKTLISSSTERALELVIVDDGVGAVASLEGLLESAPKDARRLLSAGASSANISLRTATVKRWVNLIQRWPSSSVPSPLEGAQGDDEEAVLLMSEEEGRKRGLSPLDLKVMSALAQAHQDEAKPLLRQALLGLLTPPPEQPPPFVDVKISIAEALASERDEAAFEPLMSALQSTESALVNRAVNALVNLRSPRSAPAILSRVLDDPSRSADHALCFQSLSTLRDPSIVDRLIALIHQTPEHIDVGRLSSTLLKISGHDEPISEKSVWAEMNEEAREAEEKRKRHDPTLAALIQASAHAGRYAEIEYGERLLAAARTSRSVAVDAVILDLTRLPISEETDRLRRASVEAFKWRIQHRETPPEGLLHLIEHRDDVTRWSAAEAVALGGLKEGLKVLLKLARDLLEPHSWRKRAISALGVCADLRAVRALLKIYEDSEDRLQREALEALGHMSGSEVADDLLNVLIGALPSSYSSVAISGLIHFKHPDGWSALRHALRDGRLGSADRLSAVQGLHDDLSAETTALFERLLNDKKTPKRELQRSAYRALRARWPEETLTADVALFKTAHCATDEWSEAVERISAHGDGALWLSLCFEANGLTREHTNASAQFEAQLRALDPAPIGLMMTRLSEAIEDAPQLAEFTLSLIGAQAQNLSEAQRAQLLTVTQEVRVSWHRLHEDAQLGASDAKHKRTFTQCTHSWRHLLWVWGQAMGGAAELWAAWESADAPLEIHQEALFSLEGQAISLDERLLNSPAAQRGELASWVSRLASRQGHLALDTLKACDAGTLPGIAAWNALSVDENEQVKNELRVIARSGDPLALNALIDRRDIEGLSALISLTNLADQARMDIFDAVALIGDLTLEDRLVEFAKATKDEALKRAAWRARRRSTRARAQREEQRS